MRILYAVLVIAAFVSMTGCAVGIRTIKTNSSKSEPKQSLKDVRFSYQTNDSMLSLALERVLIESYNVQDIQPLQKATGHRAEDRVVITATVMPQSTSKWRDTCIVISFLSFSVIPCIYDEERDIVLKATHNNMVISEETFPIVERSYNWLPLSLASPDYVFFLINGNEIGEQARKITVYHKIMSDFLSEVGGSLERQPS